MSSVMRAQPSLKVNENGLQVIFTQTILDVSIPTHFKN